MSIFRLLPAGIAANSLVWQQYGSATQPEVDERVVLVSWGQEAHGNPGPGSRP